jgi:hypothetical protein
MIFFLMLQLETLQMIRNKISPKLPGLLFATPFSATLPNMLALYLCCVNFSAIGLLAHFLLRRGCSTIP